MKLSELIRECAELVDKFLGDTNIIKDIGFQISWRDYDLWDVYLVDIHSKEEIQYYCLYVNGIGKGLFEAFKKLKERLISMNEVYEEKPKDKSCYKTIILEGVEYDLVPRKI